MKSLYFVPLILTLLIGICTFKHKKITETNVELCPYCFGTNLCPFDSLVIKKSTVRDILQNYFSVKNVFTARYNNKNVILKKLGHDSELNDFNRFICLKHNLSDGCDLNQVTINYEAIIDYLNDDAKIKPFKPCTKLTAKTFLHKLLEIQGANVPSEILLKNIWTILHLNVEPLILWMLKPSQGWPVPTYYGACGRITVQSDAGRSLNDHLEINWWFRAQLSLQLLQAAHNFTEGHKDFRFYLTDISVDNVAVDSNLRISFVDLENVVLSERTSFNINEHHSEYFEDDEFIYSEKDICESSKSDHNYYAICKLLLSQNAPWPMKKGGLLHSAPKFVSDSYSDLFTLIEICTKSSMKMTRIEAASKIMNILEEALILHSKFL